MKKNNLIISGVAVMVVLVAITGIAFSALAAEDTTSLRGVNKIANATRGRFMKMHDKLQKYRNLSDDEKAEWRINREERRSEREARKEKLEKAVEAGDYETWTAIVGEDHLFAGKITADNFLKLQKIYAIKKEIEVKQDDITAIMKELGIEKPREGLHKECGGMHRGLDVGF